MIIYEWKGELLNLDPGQPQFSTPEDMVYLGKITSTSDDSLPVSDLPID